MTYTYKDINEIDDAIAKMHSRHPRNDRQSAKLKSMQKPLSERDMHELQIKDGKSPNTLSEEREEFSMMNHGKSEHFKRKIRSHSNMTISFSKHLLALINYD